MVRVRGRLGGGEKKRRSGAGEVVVVVLSALCFWRNDREQHALLVPLYGGGRRWDGARRWALGW